MKKLIPFFLVLFFLFYGCKKNDHFTPEFPGPEVLHDGWKISSLSTCHLDISKIITADSILKNNPVYESIHTLTIARNGYLVLNRFYHGGPFDYHKGEITTMQSVTKSFSSLVVGIALDKGLIKSINQTAKSLLPENLAVKWTSEKDKITLKDILTMSAGFAGNEHSDSLLPVNFARYIFSKPLQHVPGTVFDYRTALANSLGDILTHVLSPKGISLEKFMDSLLFKPLQIRHYKWFYRSQKGMPELGGGLFLSPRDMIKLGQVILDDGKWNGHQIVSQKWISQVTNEYFHFDNRYWGELDGYGYLFWRRRLVKGNRSFSSIIALGYGGQYVIVVPELRLVIAITSWFPKDKNWYFPLLFVEKYILPAVQ